MTGTRFLEKEENIASAPPQRSEAAAGSNPA